MKEGPGSEMKEITWVKYILTAVSDENQLEVPFPTAVYVTERNDDQITSGALAVFDSQSS